MGIISALVIEESSRGSGIGQQLLRAAERLARDKQCAQIELSSSEKESERINFMKITATRRFANASLNICLNRLRARAFPDDRNYILPSRIFNMRRRFRRPTIADRQPLTPSRLGHYLATFSCSGQYLPAANHNSSRVNLLTLSCLLLRT